ncbi:MAG: ergothioneine biosynthesis protein EgtB [Candidatus Krumholzibacteriia bacterium]
MSHEADDDRLHEEGEVRSGDGLAPGDPRAARATRSAGRPAWSLLGEYVAVRRATEDLCAPLTDEDMAAQSMPDASPAKWHLAHTTWFFETFLLVPHLAGYEPFHPRFGYLFNSYYNALGTPFPRPRRGILTRPGHAEVRAYRRHVDDHLAALLEAASGERLAELERLLEIGLNHEQQHQELLLTDVKHLFSLNPLLPSYRPDSARPTLVSSPAGGGDDPDWTAHPGGLLEVGHAGGGFAFDNEGPRHRVFLEPFRLADRLVTCGEFVEFMGDDGYRRPDPWLSEGWDAARAGSWEAPLYWERRDGEWHVFTLAGLLPVDLEAPVCHLSFFEADAFARWAGARLPTEEEWEAVAATQPVRGHLAADGILHPVPAPPAAGGGPRQLFGDVWEWTASPYRPYPGFQAPAGALGEYNAKFMSGQMVLRGGSCVTPAGHIRATYRNFFGPAARWQFSGLRLARDGGE